MERKGKTFNLTQPGLINCILEATGMEDCRPNAVPAAPKPLGTDPEGEPMQEKWNYWSVVGMLLYLSTNTRPDIALAVSQVARFSSNPKQSHATAVKTLVRYLKGSKHVGTIFTPTEELNIEYYVDADYAGLNNVEDQDDPISAKSRTGYITRFAGCPSFWKSKLQDSTAVSTGHAKYIALSLALHQVLPFYQLIREALAILQPTLSMNVPRVVVYEDNAAALTLAQTHRLTPRTRFYNTVLHHWWEFVESGEIVVEFIKIETGHQLADYLTKPLPRKSFVIAHMGNQGI